jgi:hypothetical protein
MDTVQNCDTSKVWWKFLVPNRTAYELCPTLGPVSIVTMKLIK